MKIGQEVKIIFHDHVQDHDELVICCVYGIVLKQDKKSVTVCSWDLALDDELALKHNRLIFTLVKSAILEVKVY